MHVNVDPSERITLKYFTYFHSCFSLFSLLNHSTTHALSYTDADTVSYPIQLRVWGYIFFLKHMWDTMDIGYRL